MARIVRLNRALLLRIGLLLLVAVAIAGWALCRSAWFGAAGMDEANPDGVELAEPEGPDLAAVETPVGIIHLKRALFCLDIHNRKPVLIKSTFNRRVDYIYCYSVLTAPKEGITILHRWIMDGQPVFERRLVVAGKNCRVWSRRHLMNKAPGTGRVEIVVEDGNILGSAVFKLL